MNNGCRHESAFVACFNGLTLTCDQPQRLLSCPHVPALEPPLSLCRPPLLPLVFCPALPPCPSLRPTPPCPTSPSLGGEWISSIEIENLAMAHPAVQEAAVCAIPSAKWDERPLLVATLKHGAEGSEQLTDEILR